MDEKVLVFLFHIIESRGMLLTGKHLEKKIQRGIGCNPLNDKYFSTKIIQNFVHIIILQISNSHEKLFIHFFKTNL